MSPNKRFANGTDIIIRLLQIAGFAEPKCSSSGAMRLSMVAKEGNAPFTPVQYRIDEWMKTSQTGKCSRRPTDFRLAYERVWPRSLQAQIEIGGPGAYVPQGSAVERAEK